jgi:glyoxylase I family protein
MTPTERSSTAVSDEAGRDHGRSIHGLHGVRYQSTDVQRAVDFYTKHLGFTVEHQQFPAFASVSLGGFTLLLSGPGASGSRPMPDGRRQEAGGWNRIVLHVTDVAREIERLKKAG